MAFNEFFVESGGSDVAAGSTTGASSVTTTNGDWGSVTANRFTPNGGGTPFSAVTVGDWGSIYIDGATTLVYLAQVTAVNGGGATLDFSTTAKYGTSPAVSATLRSCKIGGAWATPYAFIGTGVTAVYNSTRINIKQGPAYAGTTTARTFNNTGSATAPLLWRGYNTTPGDIDTNNSLTKPVLSWTTATVVISGLKQQWWNLDFQSARTAGAGITIQDETYFHRCRFENTNAAAASSAVLTQTTLGPLFNYCWFKATATATRVVQITVGTGFGQCVFTGGGIGLDGSSSPFALDHCVFLNTGSHGVSFSAATRLPVSHCSFKGCAGDGLRYTVAPTAGSSLRWCLFDSCTGNAINNTSGANTQAVLFSDNDFFGLGGSAYVGFGDTPNIGGITESSNPATSSTDPTFSATSFAGASLTRAYENVTITGAFWDVGGTQRQVTSGGGGAGATILAGAGLGLVGGV